MKKKFTLLLAVLLAGFGFSAMAAVGDVFTSGGYSFKVIAEGDVNEVEFTAPATAYDLSAKTGSITMPTSVTNDGVTYSVVGIGDEAFKNAKFPTAIGILNFDRPLRYIGDYAFQGATSGGAPGKSDSHVRNIRFYCDDMTTVSPTAFVENRIIGSFLAAKRGETSDFVNKACTINYGSSNSGSLGNFCQVVDGSIILLGIGNQGNIATSSAGYVANKITINSEITVIGENAMYGNDKFTQIDLGAVEAVQAHAFKNCVFETVTIPATCTTIASDAFEGCTAIATITCNAATPPAGVVFDDAVYARISESGNITVPDEALEAYKADANWGKFWAAPAPTTYTITVADDIVNGTVEVDKAEAEEGETVTVTATPIDRSYQLKSITVTPETLNLVVEV
ncbi:MAG: leucine-rich repeat protein, partial [Muribaculaceae bacterium]|nr:leucine-rich repeat protein [Muribaculaceae bacterium]